MHKNGQICQKCAINCGIEGNASNKNITKYKNLWGVKSISNSVQAAQIKNPCIFVVPILKASVTKSARFLEQLVYNKFDFKASNFDAAVQLQFEAKQKLFVDLLLLA